MRIPSVDGGYFAPLGLNPEFDKGTTALLTSKAA